VPFPARLPVLNHVRPVHEVLVEQVGDSLGELKELDSGIIVLQVIVDVAVRIPARRFGQDLHDAKGHGPAVRGRCFEKIGKHRMVKRIEKRVGKGKRDVGADAVSFGQFHGNPALHAPALNHDDFGNQGGA